MKQFTQLLLLILLLSNIQLSANEINRNDTIGKFNEITDIELRLKRLQDSLNELTLEKVVTQDTVIIKQDSIISIIEDSIISITDTVIVPIDTIVAPQNVIAAEEDTLVLSKKKPSFIPPTIKTSLDNYYQRKINGTIELPALSNSVYDSFSPMLTYRDTMLFNPLFLPIVFTGRIDVPDSTFSQQKKDVNLKGILLSSEKSFESHLDKQKFADKVRRQYFIDHPTSINISISSLSNVTQTATDSEVREKFNPFKELLSTQTSFSLEKPDIEGTTIDRVYWIKSGDHSLQFSQNYFSPNWHKGGSSNLNINNYHSLKVNYAKERVRFNNMFEWRLSLFNAPDDSIRSYRIGNDLLRYYGDFGLDVDSKKRWSYSTNLEAKTQMLSSYLPNKTDLRSAFLAPIYVNAGIGMKYNLDRKSKTVRHRRIRLDLSISPFSVNYRYVGNRNVDEKRFGIPEGKMSIFDKGSSVSADLIYDLTQYITWKSRIKYFTNYSKVETEFENTLDMSLSRFFSTKLYLNLRYDDGVPPGSDLKYLQINEVLSFGLNYKW